MVNHKHEYRLINGVETHVLLWGDVFDSKGSDVVICITGNPGLPDFYEEFGDTLHDSLGMSVCVIGHAGHEEVPDANSNILKNQEDKFNLKGQLEHKIELINMIDKRSRLHLMGHSIGAWMVVELLDSNEDILARTATVQLLFPTLQKMAETHNGFIVNRLLRKINTLVIIFVTVTSSFPVNVKTALINMYLKLQSLPSHYISRIIKYINPRVIEKVTFLAYDEMDTVRTLNRRGLDKIKHLVNVIYSCRDGWAPISQIDDLAEYEPALQRQLVPYPHAFVLKDSVKVADMASEFIKKTVVK